MAKTGEKDKDAWRSYKLTEFVSFRPGARERGEKNSITLFIVIFYYCLHVKSLLCASPTVTGAMGDHSFWREKK